MDSMSLQYLAQTRRKLHSFAEISGVEHKTSTFIIEELKRFGYKPQTVEAGVYGDVGRGKRRLALRADMDGTIANLLNVARIVGGKSDVPLRLIFQPDAGSACGAERMIDAGILDGVEEVYALRLCPEIDDGKIGYCYGSMFAGCFKFDLDFHGKQSSSETNELGADAVRAAEMTERGAHAAAQKNGLILNLGKTNGGNARNADGANKRSEYALYFYDMAKCEQTMLDIERAALEADDMLGTTHFITSTAMYPPLINHALAVDKVRSVMSDQCVEVLPQNTADDFSLYLEKTIGCMVWLGTKTQKRDASLCNDTFGFDETALLTGTELFLKLIETY